VRSEAVLKIVLANQAAMKTTLAALAKVVGEGLDVDPAQFASAVQAAAEAGAAAALEEMIDDARVELVVDEDAPSV
jgi:hydrogenase maturation factor